jgi:hypothetical protein
MNDHVYDEVIEMITKNENQFGFKTSQRVAKNGGNS